jgi:hypothetical protein
MWPSFEDYKKALEKWLASYHPNYIIEVGDRSWTNAFAGSHHSGVIIILLLFNYKFIYRFVII